MTHARWWESKGACSSELPRSQRALQSTPWTLWYICSTNPLIERKVPMKASPLPSRSSVSWVKCHLHFIFLLILHIRVYCRPRVPFAVGALPTPQATNEPWPSSGVQLKPVRTLSTTAPRVSVRLMFKAFDVRFSALGCVFMARTAELYRFLFRRSRAEVHNESDDPRTAESAFHIPQWYSIGHAV